MPNNTARNSQEYTYNRLDHAVNTIALGMSFDTNTLTSDEFEEFKAKTIRSLELSRSYINKVSLKINRIKNEISALSKEVQKIDSLREELIQDAINIIDEHIRSDKYKDLPYHNLPMKLHTSYIKLCNHKSYFNCEIDNCLINLANKFNEVSNFEHYNTKIEELKNLKNQKNVLKKKETELAKMKRNIAKVSKMSKNLNKWWKAKYKEVPSNPSNDTYSNTNNQTRSPINLNPAAASTSNPQYNTSPSLS